MDSRPSFLKQAQDQDKITIRRLDLKIRIKERERILLDYVSIII